MPSPTPDVSPIATPESQKASGWRMRDVTDGKVVRVGAA